MGIAKTRKTAFDILLAVCEEGGKSHLQLTDAFAHHPEFTAKDRAVITQLVHGTVEELRLIDWRIGEVSKLPVAKMKPKVRCALRLGFYQLLFLDRTSNAAAISDSVELVRKAGYEGLTRFVNGVLRAASVKTDWNEPPEAVKAGLPDALWERFVRNLGKERTMRMADALRGRNPLTLRVNLSRALPEEAMKLLVEDGWRAEASVLPEALALSRTEAALPLEKTRAIREGLAAVQDLSGILAVRLAAPEKGDKVLDLCAAPGGKALHAADLIGESGSVLACDLSEKKVRLLAENVARCGFANVRTRQADALVFVPEYESAFDLVIADLPCSGLGVMGRKPEIRFRVGGDEIRSLAALQRRILRNAVRYVRPGGRLLYSTCTVTKEENQDNAVWLREEMGLAPVGIEDAVPDAFAGCAAGNCLQLLPSALSDGFFISVWEKENE